MSSALCEQESRTFLSRVLEQMAGIHPETLLPSINLPMHLLCNVGVSASEPDMTNGTTKLLREPNPIFVATPDHLVSPMGMVLE